MISVISSFDSLANSDSDPFSSLARTCKTLASHSFHAVDVIVTEADICRASKRVCDDENGFVDPSRHLKVAEALANQVSEAVRAGAVPLQIPALATNFPNLGLPLLTGGSGEDSALSERQNQIAKLRERAIANVTITLILADLLNTRVVEIVCGRNVLSIPAYPGTQKTIQIAGDDGETISREIEEKSEYVSSPTDSLANNLLRKAFATGLIDAFVGARSHLKRWPYVGIALEMEPYALAMADNIKGLNEILECVDAAIDELKRPDITDKEALKSHLGINLDIGHYKVWEERIKHREGEKRGGEDAKSNLKLLRALRPRIFHAHIADHAVGAHWVDSPLGRFRDLEAFDDVLVLYLEHMEEQERLKNNGKRTLEFFSGALAIELETCNDIVDVVECRSALQRRVGEINNSRQGGALCLESPATIRSKIERQLGDIPRDLAEEGHLEGINGSIYYSITNLLQRTDIPEGATALIEKSDLDLIARFLRTQKSDRRTQLALEIIDKTFERIGVPSLAIITRFMLRLEYDNAFYSGYRDHTVHTVMVYLLGIYLYVESEKIRALVQREQENPEELLRPTVENRFMRNWALAALTHDLGYIFESKDASYAGNRKRALDKLNHFREFYVQLVVLGGYKAKKNSVNSFDNGAFVKAINAESIIGDKIKNPKSFPDKAHLFAALPLDAQKNMELSEGGLKDIFHFLAGNEPDGKIGAGRESFWDHGFMSASLIEWVRLTDELWADCVNRNGDRLTTVNVPGMSKNKVKKIKEWARTNDPTSFWRKYKGEVSDLLLAVAAHNIYPENREEFPDGVLYKPATLDAKKQFNLRQITLSAVSEDTDEKWRIDLAMAFMLGMCDSLQEWNRYHFISPADQEKTITSPAEIKTWKDYSTGQIVFCFRGAANTVKGKEKEFDIRFGDAWKKYIKLDSEEFTVGARK